MITERFIRRLAALSVVVLFLAISVALILLEPMTLREIYNASLKLVGVTFFLISMYILKAVFNKR